MNYNTRHKSWKTWMIFRSPAPQSRWFGFAVILVKIRSAQQWGRRGAHWSENKGVKSECKKFGENSRQMAPVSTICDEYCRVALPSLDATDRKETPCCLWGYFRSSLRRQDEKGILFLVKNKVKKYILRQYQRSNTSAYCKKALKSFNFVSGKHSAAVRTDLVIARLKHRTSAGNEVGFDPEAELKRDVIRLLVTCDKMSLYFWADAELRLIFFFQMNWVSKRLQLIFNLVLKILSQWNLFHSAGPPSYLFGYQRSVQAVE